MKETIDDRRYRMQQEELARRAKLEAEAQARNDANNMALESGDVSPEVEAELTRSQAEKDMDDSMRKAVPLNKGGMLKYNEGSSVQGKKDLAKILEAGEDGADKAIVEIMKYIPGSEGPPKGLVSLLEPILRKAGEAYRAHKKEAEGSAKTKVAKNMGGSMLVPPEMGLEDDMPVDTYDNIPEDEKEAAEASQLPDDEMEEDYTDYVLEQSLDVEEQEYLMGVLENDERLSGIFDKVMDVAGEFSGEGEVEGLGTGVSDSIPARLSDGEFVFTKKATDQLGADQLQTMMDDAEKAYDGGLMKKAFGGMVDDSVDESRMGMYSDEEEEIKKQMIDANRMPSVR